MGEQKFNISLNLSNIGPHYDSNKISFNQAVDSNKCIFFATNGTGKSFISRTFRLLEDNNFNSDDLLTIGKTKADFNFTIDNTKQLSIKLEKDNKPIIKNETGLLFHTFNSDYVEDNIKPRHYSPNGDIEGYILGKAQIDLTIEKEEEQKLIDSIDFINKDIEEKISKAKAELKKAGIPSSLKELSTISKEELRKCINYEDLPSFNEIAIQLDILSKVPEDLGDITTPTLDIDSNFLNNIERELLIEYPKSEWDEEFAKYYKANRDFIESGLDNINNNCCPFCKRPLEEETLKLIKMYNDYRNNQEAKAIATLDTYIKKLKSIVQLLKDGNNKIIASRNQLNKIKQYFPSTKDFELNNVDLSDDNISLFTNLCEILQAKINNLTFTAYNVSDNINILQMFIETANKTYKDNASIIQVANKTKSESNTERLKLRRNLCKAKYIECNLELKDNFAELTKLNQKLDKQQKIIREKENLVKVSKKDKVYDTLTSFLNLFFDGKYSIDKDTFQIKFLGNTIGQKASRILSDGEKSIVAYCFYLATTHLLIEEESDYNKLFFIIDDPISSMDFHYVYMVAQSLRDIKQIFKLTNHERIWVFTHNLEFLSIIKRNHTLKYAFNIKSGLIEEIHYALLMPYESHLTDIVKISKGIKSPTHTTANSIRHVLETVCQFEFPEKSIENYIAENDILSKNAYIFSICQDLSHGKLRNQPPYSSDIIINACKVIYNFMSSKYKGQIDAIK